MTLLYKANVYYKEGGATFVIPFDYLKKTFVKAEVIDTETSNPLIYIEDYSIDGDTLYLKEPLTAGMQLHIYRETPTDSIVDFVDASILRAKHLNASQLQILHIIEESQDYMKIKTLSLTKVDEFSEVWDAFYQRIANLADPLEEKDATNKHYVDTVTKNVEDTVIDKAVSASVPRAIAETKQVVVPLAVPDVIPLAVQELRRVIQDNLKLDRGTVFTKLSTGELQVLENPLASLVFGIKPTGEIYPKEEV